MKKKVVSILVAAAVSLSLLTFVGCNPSVKPGPGDKVPPVFTSNKEVYAFSAMSATNLLGGMTGTNVKMKSYGANMLRIQLVNADGTTDPVDPNPDGTTDPVDPNPDGTTDPVDPNPDGNTDPVDPNPDGTTDPVDPNPDGTTDPVDPNNPGEVKPTDDILKAQIDQVNKYMTMFEGMLAENDPIKTTSEKNVEYKGVVYANKVTISYALLDGVKQDYVMYYDEFALTETGEEGKEVDEEEAEGIETAIKGVMLINLKEYVVEGVKEIEKDEVSVTFTSTDAEGNSVEVMQETEEGEKKFKYTVRDAQKTIISMSEIEIEKEEDEIEIKLVLIEKGNRNVYTFEKEIENGKEDIKISYRIIENGVSKVVSAKVKVEKDANGKSTYKYIFHNNEQIDKERDDD